MKKVVVTFVFLFAAIFSLRSQVRFSPTLEVVAGAGFARGPRVTVTPQFIGRLELGKGFTVGAGAGVRFAMPCFIYAIKDGEFDYRQDCFEFDIPLFLRAGYEIKMFYVNMDVGYAVGAISFHRADVTPGGTKKACFDGFFFDPHIGIKLAQRHMIALGVLLQQGNISYRTEETIQDSETSSYQGTRVRIEERRRFLPAVTLRYGYTF